MAKRLLSLIIFLSFFAASPSQAFASPSTMTQLGLFTGEGTGTHFANSIGEKNAMIMGDINQDGYDDLVVGARHYSPGGGVYIFLGKQTLTDVVANNADIILREPNEPSVFGANVSLGDINGDNILELSVSDYNHRFPSAYVGGTFFFSTGVGFNSRNTDQSNFKITGTVSNSKSSPPTEIIGDVNGDGYDDTMYSGGSTSNMYLFYGSQNPTSKSLTQADVIYNFTENNMCPASPPRFLPNVDLNKDGYIDIIIGCKYGSIDSPSGTAGRVYIFFGGNNLTNKDFTQADVTISPSEGSDAWGFGVDLAVGDINNDGKNELITKEEYGGIFIYNGRDNWQSQTTAQANMIISPAQDADPIFNLGGGLFADDFNNDGVSDLVVGDSTLGRASIFYGRTDFGSMDTSQANLYFNTSGVSYGSLVFSSGEMNNDGYMDLAVSDHRYNNQQGAVYIVTPPHGTPTITPSSISYTNNLSLSGTVTDTLTVGGVEVSLDNGSWSSCTVISDKYTCSLPSSLSEGSHTARLRSHNSLGVYMATREYASTSFSYDHTPPTSFSGHGGSNISTRDSLPTFDFSKSLDSGSGLSHYEVVVDGSTYLTNINPLKPSDTDFREDEDKYVRYYDDKITVQAKKETSRLENGNSYKWRIRAVDNAGNSTETDSKILRIGTNKANFSGTYFPISILSIGSISLGISTLHLDQIPAITYIASTTPTFYGIAPVGSEITLRIEKDNNEKSGRDLVLSKTSQANQSSRFGINVTDKLPKRQYYVSISGTNPQGDYIEIPEFKVSIGSSGYPTRSKSLTTVSSILEVKPNELPPVVTTLPTPSPSQPPAPTKSKHCFLWWCF